ncbi:MAG: DUF2182 domain-containing protein, partial [Actinobacteria bacterium]|nr:DUF2182 domain-containing protein [Actinomycetota bacterium]
MTRQVQVRGIPSPRTWTRVELLLAAILLALAAVAWLLTNSLVMPNMRMGILTGTRPREPEMGAGSIALGLFLVTWVVMMAAMMLPAITPFTVGISRLMRARHADGGSLAALTIGYLLV